MNNKNLLVEERSAQESRRSFIFGSLAVLSCSPITVRGATSKSLTPGCVLSTQQEEGPFYLDLDLMRGNITEGRPGVPLKLQVTVLDSVHCAPLRNALVDIWHCDASGFYSGFTASNPDNGPGGGPPPGGFGGPPPGQYGPPPGRMDARPLRSSDGGPRRGPRPQRRTDETTFFRGVQLTDEQGVARFTTIYPGWYVSRDIHIHVKVHTGGQGANTKYSGGHISHVGQFFFPDELSDRIARLEPYASHHARRTRLDEDHVYQNEQGASSMLTITPLTTSLAEGLTANAVVAVDPRRTFD